MHPTRQGRPAVSAASTPSAVATADAVSAVSAVVTGTAGSPAGYAGPTVLPAAAGQPVLDLLTGQLRPATVIGVHPAAVLVVVDPLPGEGRDGTPARVVTVVAADGSGVPNGLRVAVPSGERPFAEVAAGDPAFVGAGGVRLAGFEVRVARSVRTQVPRVSCPPAAVARIAAAADLATLGVPVTAVDDLRAAQRDHDPAALRRAVQSLVGLGTGSTPGGDDVLAGALAGLHATGRDVLVQQIWVAARDRLAERTTVISADLLRLAAHGHACAEAIGVLRAAARGLGQRTRFDEAELDEALHRLLAVGHTSGADLATGLAIGLSAPTFATPHQPRLAIRPARPLTSGRP